MSSSHVSRPSRRGRRFCWLAMVLLLAAAAACGTGPTRPGPPIVIAADGRVEQQLLAQLTAQLLRDRGYAVEIRTGLHAEWMVRRALEAGNIGLAWQETGRVWHTYLSHDQPITGEAELFRRVRQEDRLNGIVWLNPCAGSARLGIVVTNELAAANRLATIGDLASHINRAEPDLVLCAPEELYDSPWGVRGMERVYGFRFKPANVRAWSHTEAYQGLLEGSCDVALGYAKDTVVYGGRLVTLRDARAFFSASSLAPTVHFSLLAEYPELERVLAELTDKLDMATLAAMEHQIAAGRARTDRLAQQFLRDNALIGRR